MLKLYTFAACPYCEKVRTAFEEMNIDYEEILAEKGTEQGEELRRMGGKLQVPYLVDMHRGVQMYESDDIIAYAKKHYSKD